MQQVIFWQEMALANAPPLANVLGLGLIGPTLIHFGTPAQKERFLRKILSAEEIWCQGFSEPDAGSDLASLRTRAALEGDHFTVTGQKIWTSRAMFADFCFLLARTSTEGPKHAGISAIIVDMKTPGVTVRPIVEITRNRYHFCQVFFDDAVVPAENLIGELNQGWTIAQTTLSYERGPADIGGQAQYPTMLRRIRDLANQRGLARDTAVRRACARAAVAVEVLRLRSLWGLSERTRGEPPGPSGSIDKLLWSSTEQTLYRTAMDVLGPDASLTEEEWYNRYLRSRAATILGGTSQIQKNILATRVLGLPRR
jgi:alkylation response protein AidB-like acyl-CoA dehydrogenase